MFGFKMPPLGAKLILALLGLAGLGQAPLRAESPEISLAAPLPAEPLRLMLDWYVNPDHAPIILAQDLGYFREAGLEVEIIAPADPSEPPKLVAAGQADLAVSYQPQLHLQRHEGLPLRRVGTLVATPLTCLMVKAAGPVQKLEDLKGRKIGFAVAGVQEAMAHAMLQTVDLPPASVELIQVNFALTSALLSDQVDAVIGAFRNFELTQMRLAGGEGRCFYPEEAGIPAYDELIFVAHADAAGKDSPARDKLRRFMGAVERGTLYMMNHPDAAYAVFSKDRPELQDALNRQAWADTLPRFAHSPAAFDHGRYARFEAFLKAAGLTQSILPVGDLAVDLGQAQ